MSNLLEVKKSSIHGKGVFAQTDIPMGTIIPCDILCFPTLPEELVDYVMPFQNEFFIIIGAANFLNHSRQPSVKILSLDRAVLQINLIVLRDIKAGEEVTLHYDEKSAAELD